MILSTKLIAWSLAGGTSAGIVSSLANAGFLDATGIAAAFSGSVSAIMIRALSDKPRKPQSSVRAVTVVVMMFFVGASFGLFMGPALAGAPLIDRTAGTYLGGALGFGVVAMLVSDDAIKRIANFILKLFDRGSAS